MNKKAFAIAAHPDDIELMMLGTLMLLGEAGYELHYMNLANGSCGTASEDKKTIISIRSQEALAAAKKAGACFHEPLVDDLMVYYTPELNSKLCAIIREVGPEILLIPSPHDYMEDHTITARLAVTSAFCRGMLNFATEPTVPPIDMEMALYHALPWGLQDQLRNPVHADFFVDISSVIDRKRDILACHQSQKQWLDASQGLDSYLTTMVEMSGKVGKLSGRFEYAEGWQRHAHLGFGDERFDPLAVTLNDFIVCAEDQK